MDGEFADWEAKLGSLTPEQRQHLLEWLREEQEGWSAREEEWQRVHETMSSGNHNSSGNLKLGRRQLG